MALSENEIREIIKKPKNSIDIQAAAAYEEKLRMHTESYLNRAEVGRPLNDFAGFVSGIIPPDKARTFNHILSFPLSTTSITKEAYTQLRRVYDGRDTVESYVFENPELNQDWDAYRETVLKDPESWNEKSWEAVKSRICSILVCDLPTEQKTERPSPYSYFLNIGSVIDFGFANGQITYLAFWQSKHTAVIIDDSFYRVAKVDAKKDITILSEVPHNVGYCPAQFFWSDALTCKDVARKKSPISDALGLLDWWLFFHTSKKHLDTYASYPIYSAYEQDCDYENGDTGAYCDGGFLRDRQGNYVTQNGQNRCPVCESKALAGAGSMIEIPIPSKEDDVPDLKNPVTLTTIDRNSLDYNVEEEERLRINILNNIVGTTGEAERKEAVNETQIKADYEGRTSVLRDLKINLEKAYKFKNDTICKLRYGDAYLGSTYNMGEEFYIYSAVELREKYKQAKDQGASTATLDNLDEQILLTEHRNDVPKLQRMQILRHLEPYRHFTTGEIMDLKKEGLTDEAELKVKINFNTFVERFERENGDIRNFAVNKTFHEKINLIKKTFSTF